jgi:hypothetical protein
MVFKKDLTPLSKKGTIDKHNGKGGAEHKPDYLAKITNRYPKPKTDAETGMPSPLGTGSFTPK